MKVVAAGADIAMVIDAEGVICDMALNNEDMIRDGAGSWLDQRWADTVTLDSRHKVDELLREALSAGHTPWRELSQITPSRNALMMRYVAVDAGREGHVIAIGRDDRATWAAQQRLLEAQQALERDYARLRDAEFRYRLLFEISGEAVLVVDIGTKKVVEANPAAETLVGNPNSKLIGAAFSKIFDVGSLEEAASLLTAIQSTARTHALQRRMSSRGRELLVSASLFRHHHNTLCLVRLIPAELADVEVNQAAISLQTLMDWVPDAFVITDVSLNIVAVNTPFLDLVRLPTREQARGESLNEFLGRAGLERNILVDTLREHGSVHRFATVLRSRHGGQEDVEVSAVLAADGAERCFAFTIRNGEGRIDGRTREASDRGRSIEQLAELVGRVKLKDLVRESTDLIERLCIEAALELTKNNRASAADVLGVSRQSLYSKMHRFGLGNLADGGD